MTKRLIYLVILSSLLVKVIAQTSSVVTTSGVTSRAGTVVTSSGTHTTGSVTTGGQRFTGLLDTPKSYSGSAGYLVRVNANGNRLEFLNSTALVGVTDHGALTGLADDDHSQYHNDARALTWLGTKSTSNLAEGTNLYYTAARSNGDVLQVGTEQGWNKESNGGTMRSIQPSGDNGFSFAVSSISGNGGALRGTINTALFQSANGNLTSWSNKSIPSGAVVGTTDTQTLTNKTLQAATLNGITIIDNIRAKTTAGTLFESLGGTDIANFGVANTANVSFNAGVSMVTATFNGNSMTLPTLGQGSLLYAKSSGVLKELAKGTDHYVLKVNGNKLAWEPVSGGGGGSASGAAGSIQFSDGTNFTSDNSNFYWDDTNNRLGIGTNSPVRAKTKIVLGSATEQGLVLQAAASQTGNLTEWRDSTGTILNFIASDGSYYFGSNTSKPVIYTSGTSILIGSVGKTSGGGALMTLPGFLGTWSVDTGQGNTKLSVNHSTGITFDNNNYGNVFGVTHLGVAINQKTGTSGSPAALSVTGGPHTTLTASTEATDINFNLARTVQFSTGALTTQRAVLIQAPTYSFVGASTLTTAATMEISGAPIAGTNATITNAYGLRVNAGQSTAVPLVVKAAASQTANLTEWQNSAGTVLSFMDNGGRLNIGDASRKTGFNLDVNGAMFAKRINLNGTDLTAGGGSGDVTGGSSSAINGVPLFSATTGKAIKYDPNFRMVSRSANSIYIGNGAGAAANGTTLQNTALGFNALTGGTSFTGDANTAVGYDAGRVITTGSNNTFLGTQAGEGILTGSSNTLIGQNAMQSNNEFNVSGSFNTCVGARCFLGAYSVTNGNTAVGYNTGALGSFATASRNTLLGYQAGNNLTSGNNNIVIGYDIDTPVASGSNSLTIGNLIYGNGLTAIGTTVSSGKVGIKQPRPNFDLDVNGSIETIGLAVTNGAYSAQLISLGNGGTTESINCTKGMNFALTLNATTLNPLKFEPKPLGPTGITLYLTQGTGGSKTVTWNGNISWPAATAPTLSTTAGKIDMINCRYQGSTTGKFFCTYALGY